MSHTVYIIGPAVAPKFVKVGVTGGAAKRRRDELQTGNPERLCVFAAVRGLGHDDALALERLLISESRDFAVAHDIEIEGRGEWIVAGGITAPEHWAETLVDTALCLGLTVEPVPARELRS